MRQDMLKQAAAYHKEHRQKMKRYKVFSALAAAVVFCTTMVLIMPAATMENALKCDLEEHVHTEECLGAGTSTLVCGLEESEGGGHVHSKECYETEEVKTLTCGLEEAEAAEGHAHGESCYTEEPVYETQTVTVDDTEVQDVLDEEGNVIGTESVVTGTHEEEVQVQVDTVRTLVCELEESEAVEGHTHSDECYTVETEEKLICTEEEGQAEAHAHSEDCYETEMVYGCGLEEHEHTDECRQTPHEHGEDCYTTVKTLTCGEEESEEHTHDDSCYTEEQVLTCTEGEEPAEEPQEAAPVELTETFDFDYYQAVFHVTYNGETAEDDELAFYAQTVNSADDESDRFYDYLGGMPLDGKLQPVGRTEFGLTRSGEEVDRSEYTVYVEIIPSREMAAWLAMMDGGQTAETLELLETLDLHEDEELPEELEELTINVPRFMLYQMVGGEVAEMGSVEMDTSVLTDLDAYMALFAEEPYDITYRFFAGLNGNDFVIAAGLREEVIDTLAEINLQAWRDTLSVLWDGYTPNSTNTGGSHKTNEHVAEVYMTHSDSSGVKDENAQQVKIWEGTADQNPYSVSYGGTGEYADGDKPGNGSIGDKKVNLKQNVYLNASNSTTLVSCSLSEATQIKITYRSNYGTNSKTVKPTDTGNNGWNWASTIKVGDVWNYYVIEREITKVEYLKESGIDYALLEIVPDPGYYVTQVVIACTNNSTRLPTGCNVWNDKAGVFTSTFGVSEGSRVSLTVPSSAFCHYASNASSSVYGGIYYILIQTAPIPSPLFVSYEYGAISDFGATSNTAEFQGNAWLAGGRTTVAGNNVTSATTVDQLRKMSGQSETAQWADGELDYYVADISKAAEDYANANGYRFAGWRLEYWGDVTKNIKTPYTDVNQIQNVKFPDYSTDEAVNERNGFAGSLFIPENQLADSKNLMTNAKLIAQWEKIPAAEVVKSVENLKDENDTQNRTYNFTIANNENKDFTFEATVMQYVVVNGVRVQAGETKQTVTSQNGVANFSITVYGNGSERYKISGLPNGTYTVTELNANGVDANGEKFTTNYDKQVIEIRNTGAATTVNQAQTVNVTNDYKGRPTTFDLTVQKVTGTKQDGVVPTTAWAALSGAKFDLYSVVDGVETKINTESISPINNTNTNATAKVETLSFDTLYKLVETEAPAGYNMLAEPIYFKATADGIVLCNADGTVKTADEYANAAKVAATETTEEELVLIVANYGGYTLPSTGGPGVSILYALGGTLLMLAAAFLVYNNLRERRRAVIN